MTTPYLKLFKREIDAISWMRMKNHACKLAKNYRDLFAVTDGPENNFAVMDIKSILELGNGYKIEY